jgi:hypothetical protein
MSARTRNRSLCLAALLAGALVFGGCSKVRYVDMQPLEQAGMRYETTKQLRELNVTEEEVAELLLVKQVRLSDAACVELVQRARFRQQPFTDGDEISSLLGAGLKEAVVMELVRLNQLGLLAEEYKLMHQALMSDTLILTLARRRAEGLPTVSGGALARLKNAGISEGALVELARRGITDAEADAIFARRRRGMSESAILRSYPIRE